MCEKCGFSGCYHDDINHHDLVDPCARCGPPCSAWMGDGLCRYEIERMAYGALEEKGFDNPNETSTLLS